MLLTMVLALGMMPVMTAPVHAEEADSPAAGAESNADARDDADAENDAAAGTGADADNEADANPAADAEAADKDAVVYVENNVSTAAAGYSLWIGGVQVTGEKTGGSGWSYDPSSRTLTLNGASISGVKGINDIKACIYSSESDLRIELQGSNTVGGDDANIGIYVDDGNLTIQGNGSLTVSVSGDESDAIFADNGDYGDGSIYIKGGTITAGASGEDAYAVDSLGNVYISGGTLNASVNGPRAHAVHATDSVIISGGEIIASSDGWKGIGLYGKAVNISGGTVTASASGDSSRAVTADFSAVSITGGTVTASARGSDAYGIYSYDELYSSGRDITVGRDTKLTASGDAAAIRGNVKNQAGGTGWTNTGGTEGKADIPVSTGGQSLSYKKVRFPAVVLRNIKVVDNRYVQVLTDKKTAYEDDTITVKAWSKGAYSPAVYVKKTSDGSVVQEVELTYNGQTFSGTFTMPDYDVTVEGVAQGAGDGGTDEDKDSGSSGKSAASKGPDTGDEQNATGWIAMMIASALALAGLAIKRKNLLHR